MELLGKMLGNKYRIVARLGRGGMADVYKAYQPGLDRYVAIKVLHSHLSSEEDFIGRFEREALAVAKLRHPNIVQVIDFDHEDDLYYMVMEFIEGPTLKEELKQRSTLGRLFSAPEIAKIFNALCGAIDYAHGRGMIHRDLKPANIMFTGDGQVILTDFGIAKIVGATKYTMTGAVSGTPAYMSPEQGQGERGDERSDIYALGVILYEMVTGRVPFDADTPFAIIMKHINDPLPLPRSINTAITEQEERVILKALAKNPNDRFQNGDELSKALRDAIGVSVDQTLPSTPVVTIAPPPRIQEIAIFDRATPLPRGTAAAQSATMRPPAGAAAASPPPIVAEKKSTSLVPFLAGAAIILLLVVVAGGGLLYTYLTKKNETPPATAASTPFAAVVAIEPTPTFTMTPAPSPTMTNTPAATASPQVLVVTATPSITPTPAPVTDTPTAAPAAVEPTKSATSAPKASPTVKAAAIEPTATTKAESLAISGKLAVPVDNGSGRYDVFIYSLPGGEVLGKIQGARQPNFGADGRLLVNGEGGGQEDIWMYNSTGGGGVHVTGSPLDNHPFFKPDTGAVVVDNPEMVHSKDVGPTEWHIFVYNALSPQPNDVVARDFKLGSDSSDIFDGSQPLFPLWGADDFIYFRACDYWQTNGGGKCGLYKAPSYMTKGGGNNFSPPGQLVGDNSIPTDTKGDRLVYMNVSTGNYEVYVTSINGGAKTNISNDGGQDGLGTLSPDLKWIAFVSNRDGAWAIWVAPSGGGNAKKLFNLPAYGSGPFGQGKRDWTTERISWGP
jgi:serine/threonine protein kinase